MGTEVHINLGAVMKEKKTKFVLILRMWEIENAGLSILRCLR